MNAPESLEHYLSKLPDQVEIADTQSISEDQNHYGEASLDTGTIIGMSGIAIALAVLVAAKANEWIIRKDGNNSSKPSDINPSKLQIVEEE